MVLYFVREVINTLMTRLSVTSHHRNWSWREVFIGVSSVQWFLDIRLILKTNHTKAKFVNVCLRNIGNDTRTLNNNRCNLLEETKSFTFVGMHIFYII